MQPRSPKSWQDLANQSISETRRRAGQFAIAEVITHLVPTWTDREAESKFFGDVLRVIQQYDEVRSLQLDALQTLVTELLTNAPVVGFAAVSGLDLSKLKAAQKAQESKTQEEVKGMPDAATVVEKALAWWREEGRQHFDGAPWWVCAADYLSRRK